MDGVEKRDGKRAPHFESEQSKLSLENRSKGSGSDLKELPLKKDPTVLVGLETSDDAGVYQLNNEIPLIWTVDFFTPIVCSSV
jgi:hypothetical protein